MNHHRILLPVVVLLSAACVCTGLLPGSLGGGAEALPLTQTHRNEAGGFSFDLPEGWAAEALFSMTFAAETEAGIESDTIEGPVFLAVFDTIENMAEGASSPEEMLGTSTAEEFTSDFEISEVKSTTIGGAPGAYADIAGSDPETGLELEGRIASVLSDTHAGLIIFAAPSDRWDDLLPTFEAMLDSFSFFEANPDAIFGDAFPEIEPEVDEADSQSTDDDEPFSGGEVTAAGPIAIGDTKNAVLEDGGSDEWTIDIPAGGAITVTVQPQNDDLDAELALIGPDGTLIEEVDFGFSGGSEEISYESANGGLYVARVEPFGFGGGPYSISVVGSEGGGSSGGDSGSTSGGTTAIEFVNQSSVDMCRVYAVLSDEPSWGADRLDFADAPPGGSHVLSGIPAGTYDIKVEDCDWNVLAWNMEIDVPVSAVPIEAPVENPAYTVSFENDLDEAVCEVYLRRVEELGDGWRRNLLGEDEPIEVGDTRWFKAGQGEWGFRIETCGGFLIEVVGETINGKVEYALSDF